MVELGDQVPRRGNIFTRSLGRFVLWCLRWKIDGIPPNTNKFVMTAAPHTSNWDGIYFIMAAFALGLDVHWVGKHTLFKGRWAPLLRYMGGISVNRGKAQDFVQQMADEFARRKNLIIVMAPEGTRKYAEKWKNGFCRIAAAAEVPIVLGYMDYKRKQIGMDANFLPTGDIEADMSQIYGFYRTITPKFPENYSVPQG